MRRYYLLPAVFSAVFFYYPLAVVVLVAVREGISVRLLDESVVSAFIFSVSQALLSSFLSVVLALPVAYALAKCDFKGKALLEAAFGTAFMLPPISVAVAFRFLYGAGGLIPLPISEGIPGIIAAHVFYNAPFSALIIASVWSMEGEEIVDSLRVYSRSWVLRFFRVDLPYILPAVLAAFSISFLYCFTSLEIVLILGGGRYFTVEAEIYTQYLVFFNEGLASMLAIIQLALLMAVFYAYIRASRREGAGGTPLGPEGRQRVPPLLLAYLFAFSAFVILPIAYISLMVFLNPVTRRPSLDGIRYIFSGRYNPVLGAEPWRAVVNSLAYSLLSALISVLMGLASSASLRGGKGESVVGVLSFAPSATSRITLALGFILAFSGLIPVWASVIIVHSLISYPFALRIIAHGIEALGEEILEATEVFSGEGYAMRKIVLPLVSRSLVTAFFVSMAVSLGEFGASSLLTGGRYITLTVLIYRMLGARRPDVAGAAAGLLVLMTVSVFALAEKAGERVFS